MWFLQNHVSRPLSFACAVEEIGASGRADPIGAQAQRMREWRQENPATWEGKRPARTVDRWTGSVTARFRTFRKHRRPCGQPAVVGEIGCFRPEPPQAGHLERINATPSNFPFKSTGFATYPARRSSGQSSGPLLLPLVLGKFSPRLVVIR